MYRFFKFTALFLFYDLLIITSVFQTPNGHTEVSLSYDALLTLSKNDIVKIDIAKMNLICAKGLPGTEYLDVFSTLSQIQKWTDFVKKETERQLYRFYQNPHNFNNSLAYFKILVMVTAIQRDLGARYNMSLVNSGTMTDISSTKFFKNPSDLFLHGFFTFPGTGSCSSMPVLMVAIGKRLGYPLKLVTTKGHLFARWDNAQEKFNIETSGRGLSCFPDSYYRNWPYKTSSLEIDRERYLKSLTPQEELAVFLEIRAMCLKENRMYDQALMALEKAYEIKPESILLPLYINDIIRLIREK